MFRFMIEEYFCNRISMTTHNHPPYNHTVAYFVRNLSVVLGIVLIWRGMWYVLDAIDILIFGGNHGWSSLLWIVVGVAVLYVPDHDLKELTNL
jgi:hypothetical protein